jgi:hypothetical protein
MAGDALVSSDGCMIWTYQRDVQRDSTMPPRTKRTYNLTEETVRRVRELASDYEVAPSQDAVVELAVDRLYRDAREQEESGLWAAAAEDLAFRREVGEIAAAFDDTGPWPA